MGLIIVMVSIPFGAIYETKEKCEGVTDALEVYWNYVWDQCYDTGNTGETQFQIRTCEPEDGNITIMSYGNDSTCSSPHLLKTETHDWADGTCRIDTDGGTTRWWRGFCNPPTETINYDDYAHLQKHRGPDCRGALFLDYYVRPSKCGNLAEIGSNGTVTCTRAGKTIKIFSYANSQCDENELLYKELNKGDCGSDGESTLIACPALNVGLIVGLALGIALGICLAVALLIAVILGFLCGRYGGASGIRRAIEQPGFQEIGQEKEMTAEN